MSEKGRTSGDVVAEDIDDIETRGGEVDGDLLNVVDCVEASVGAVVLVAAVEHTVLVHDDEVEIVHKSYASSRRARVIGPDERGLWSYMRIWEGNAYN